MYKLLGAFVTLLYVNSRPVASSPTKIAAPLFGLTNQQYFGTADHRSHTSYQVKAGAVSAKMIVAVYAHSGCDQTSMHEGCETQINSCVQLIASPTNLRSTMMPSLRCGTFCKVSSSPAQLRSQQKGWMQQLYSSTIQRWS